jgi:hypothetical protein
LNVPPNPWLTYFIPGAVILLGAVLLVRGFQLWKKPLAAEPVQDESDAKPVPQDKYLAKMEEELRKRK